jgi:hypothetical protein
VSELGQMLPDLIETDNKQYELIFIKEAYDVWLCRYCRNNDMVDVHPFVEPIAKRTLSEVISEMLIHLLEIKLITPEECNIRLQEA